MKYILFIIFTFNCFAQDDIERIKDSLRDINVVDFIQLEDMVESDFSHKSLYSVQRGNAVNTFCLVDSSRSNICKIKSNFDSNIEQCFVSFLNKKKEKKIDTNGYQKAYSYASAMAYEKSINIECSAFDLFKKNRMDIIQEIKKTISRLKKEIKTDYDEKDQKVLYEKIEYVSKKINSSEQILNLY